MGLAFVKKGPSLEVAASEAFLASLREPERKRRAKHAEAPLPLGQLSLFGGVA